MIDTVNESMPLQGTGTDAVLAAVTKILGIGDVVAIEIDARDDAVRYKRIATPEEQAEQKNLTYHDVLRVRTMEEYEAPDDSDAYYQLFEMFKDLEDAGFAPLVILSGRPIKDLRKWAGLLSRKTKKMFGVPVMVDENIPEDNLILCGTDGRGTGPEAVQYSIKVSLP